MKRYWLILGTEITDQVAQDEYNRLWAPIAEKYQARLRASFNNGGTFVGCSRCLMRRLGFVIPRGKAMLDFGDDRRSVESNLPRGAIAPSSPSRRANERIAGDRSRFRPQWITLGRSALADLHEWGSGLRLHWATRSSCPFQKSG
jgi:hypothetical protein